MRRLVLLFVLIFFGVGHVRAQVTSTGGIITGAGSSAQAAGPTPVITNVGSSNVLIQTVTVGWATDIAGTSQVCYSTDHNYGTCTTLDATLVVPHSVIIIGLPANTQQFYIVKSKDAFGNEGTSLITPGEKNFTTANSPTLSNVAEGVITDSSATITWTSSEVAGSQVCYSEDHAYGTCEPGSENTTQVISHSVVLSALNSATTYFYVVKSTATIGGITATSSEGTFDTTAPSPPGAHLATLPTATVTVTRPWTIGSTPGTGGRPASGRNWTVDNCGTSPTGTGFSGTYQYVLNNATIDGDEIKIDSSLDCTYSSPLTYPKTTAGWVVVTTSAYASLPAAGTRIDPTVHAQYMPRLSMTTGNGNLLRPANGARGYFFEGAEWRFTPGTETTASYGIFTAAPTSPTLDSHATNEIVVSHVWAHCDPWQSCTRGMIQTGGRNFGLVDSYINDAKTTNGQQDGGGVVGSNLDFGPFLIQNSYISATGESIMWASTPIASPALRTNNTVYIYLTSSHPYVIGNSVTITGVADASFNGVFTIASISSTSFTFSQTGADTSSGPATPGAATTNVGGVIRVISMASAALPYDITVYGNHVQNQLHWYPYNTVSNALYDGGVAGALPKFRTKNMFELKCASRVDLNGNVFEGKMGSLNNTNQYTGMTIKGSQNSIAGNTNCYTFDVTFRNNVVRHTNGGISTTGRFSGSDENGIAYFNNSGDSQPGTVRLRRMSVYNTLFDDVQAVPYDDQTQGTANHRAPIWVASNALEQEFTHNTAIHSDTALNKPMTFTQSWNRTTGPGSPVTVGYKYNAITEQSGNGQTHWVAGSIIKDNFFEYGSWQRGNQINTVNTSWSFYSDPLDPVEFAGNFLGSVSDSTLTCANTNLVYLNCATTDAKYFGLTDAAFFTANFENQPSADFRLKVASALHNGASDGTDVGINDWTKIPQGAGYTGVGGPTAVVPLTNPITATSMSAPVVCNGTNTVTITGTNFAQRTNLTTGYKGLYVVFDLSGSGRLLREENGSLVVNNATTLTIKPPTRAAGTYKVFVYYAGQLAGSNTNNIPAGTTLTFTCN